MAQVARNCASRHLKAPGALKPAGRFPIALRHPRGGSACTVLQRDSPVASFSDVSSDDERVVSSLGATTAPSDAAHLFDSAHIFEWTPLLALYFPFGCVLALVRSALWIAGIALDAPWFRNEGVVNSYLKLLGVTVTWRNTQYIPSERHILLSNHISVGDLMFLFNPPLPRQQSHATPISIPAHVMAAAQQTTAASGHSLASTHAASHAQDTPVHPNGAGVHHASTHHAAPAHGSAGAPAKPPRYVHLITSALPPRVTQTKHLPVVLLPASPATYDQLATTSDPAPVHLFPEGGMTNGSGMMRFSRGFTKIMQGAEASGKPPMPVVPLALRIKGTLPGVNSHTLTSSFLANLFWLSFSPSMTLEATVLPAMRPREGEARGAFVNRVQEAIAGELGVPVSQLTIQQKRQMAQGATKAAKGGRR